MADPPVSTSAAPTAGTTASDFFASIDAEHRDWLRAVTERCRDLIRRSVVNMLRAGLELLAVKAKLPRRAFSAWVRGHLPWSLSQAYRLMGVAARFAPFLKGNANPEQIDPTAFYLLASPAVPDSCRALALQMSERQRVTAFDARQIIAELKREKPDLPRGELREYERAAARVGRVDNPPPAERAPRTAWGSLQLLYDVCRVVHIGRATESGEELASVTVYLDDDGEQVHNVRRATLEEAVLAAAELINPEG